MTDEPTAMARTVEICVVDDLSSIEARAHDAYLSIFLNEGGGLPMFIQGYCKGAAAEQSATLNTALEAISYLSAEISRLQSERDEAREMLKSEQQSVAVWMFTNGYATGHGDTTASMLSELEGQAVSREHQMLNRIARIDGAGDGFMGRAKAGTFDDCINRLGALDDLTRRRDWK